LNNVGIIAEYNPFHNGHLYHLQETKKLGQADHVVVIMSGNFTQRGEPALYDKWTRAEMAVRNGVDLVIELPFVFACNNAEYFAMGAVRILNGLGCISHLSFGSESGELEGLLKVADLLAEEEPEFKEALMMFLGQGLSYPRARYEALKKLEGEEVAALIRDPNNILAVEYLKQWILTASQMKPIVVKRKGRSYHDESIDDALSSATAIRRKLEENRDIDHILHVVPQATTDTMRNAESEPVTDSEDLFTMLVYKILITSNEELAEILSAGEGLENKLKKAVIKSKNLNELIASVLSKRYTETRIKRLLLHTLISLRKDDFFRNLENPHLYARVLAFSGRGAKLLRHIKRQECNSIPIITNLNKEVPLGDPLWEFLRYDVLASDIYNLAYNKEIYRRSDYVCKPYCEDRNP